MPWSPLLVLASSDEARASLTNYQNILLSAIHAVFAPGRRAAYPGWSSGVEAGGRKTVRASIAPNAMKKAIAIATTFTPTMSAAMPAKKVGISAPTFWSSD